MPEYTMSPQHPKARTTKHAGLKEMLIANTLNDVQNLQSNERKNMHLHRSFNNNADLPVIHDEGTPIAMQVP